MSSHVSVAQRFRHLCAAVRGSKISLLLFRCFLKVALYPGMLSLATIIVLYSIAEYTFTTFYFVVLGWVWKPAFPLTWRLVLLSLFVVPTFSFFHLLRLSTHRFLLVRRGWAPRYDTRSRGYSTLPRSESNSLEYGEPASEGHNDDYDSDIEFWDTGSPRQARFQRRPRLSFSAPTLPHFIIWVSILSVSLWYGMHYRHPGDARYLPLIEKANTQPNRAGYGRQEKIFIAAMFYNNEAVIPYWSDSLVKAIHYLGPDNVYVSILESASHDQSPALLEKLDRRLATMQVARRILVRDEAISRPDKLSQDNRIGFLAALRNRVLEPLVESGGYDKVIFSNDVYIEPESIIELLETADGEYDMACGMDFGHFGAYDMWVLRDKLGKLTSGIWPYFFDYDGQRAMKTESPVPVFTCWNGIVAFKADPVLPIHLRFNHTLSSDPLPFELPSAHPAAHNSSLRGPSPALTPPVSFRKSAPEECYSSESFLLPYDFRRMFNLQRIFSNPRVIVAYDWRFYVYFKWWMRHPVVKWWIEKVYEGAWMHKAVMVVGDDTRVWRWDGGDCHPWW